MRMSLAVGMIPRTDTMGTHVMVPSGKWKVGHNAKDSELCLFTDEGVVIDIAAPITFDKATSVQLRVTKGGTERFILAYLDAA